MNYMNHNMIYIIHFQCRWRHTSINKNTIKQYYYLHKYIHIPYCEQINCKYELQLGEVQTVQKV